MEDLEYYKEEIPFYKLTNNAKGNKQTVFALQCQFESYSWVTQELFKCEQNAMKALIPHLNNDLPWRVVEKRIEDFE